MPGDCLAFGNPLLNAVLFLVSVERAEQKNARAMAKAAHEVLTEAKERIGQERAAEIGVVCSSFAIRTSDALFR